MESYCSPCRRAAPVIYLQTKNHCAACKKRCDKGKYSLEKANQRYIRQGNYCDGCVSKAILMAKKRKYAPISLYSVI